MDEDAFDVWSVVHHLYGAYFAAVLNMRPTTIFFVALAWESFENTHAGSTFWDACGQPGYTGDTAKNAITDIVMTMSGCLVAAHTRNT